MGEFTSEAKLKKQSIFRIMKSTWRVAAPYWTQSEERFGSIFLLALSVGVMLLGNAFNLRYVIWSADWTNLLVNKDVLAWRQNIIVFLILGLTMTISSVIQSYLVSWVQLRWKRWMTSSYLKMWLDKKSHYKMSLTGNETDNPDQRLSEDIAMFILNAWTIVFDLARNLISMVTYIIVLWGYSNVPVEIGGKNIAFPGYLVLMSFIWAAVTTLISHYNGKKISRLTFSQQMYDANFRFSLMRVRENSEQVALLKGEGVEHKRLMSILGDSVLNSFRMMAVNLRFGMVNGMLSYVDAMMFTFVLGPAWLWLGGIADYGTFQLIATAFLNVVTAFKWIQTQYVSLSVYVAVTDRLVAFNENYIAMKKVSEGSELERVYAETDDIDIKDLDIYLPNGNLQIKAEAVDIKPGDKVLVKGRTGSGKTTLFRVLSGIWPFAKGKVTLPQDKRVLVLPQRPYFPIATLEEAVSYPASVGTYKRDKIRQAIIDVGMPQFADRLDEIQHWNMILSGGEQQRLGIARAMLFQPEYLFFDEATASMDEESESEIYTMLLDRMKDTTIISIGHRSSMQQFHKRLLYAESATPGKTVPPFKLVE